MSSLKDYNVHYWVFCESQLEPPLRAWANDPRHEDISDAACKVRFEAVSGFLYSNHAEKAGLHKGPELEPVTTSGTDVDGTR